jgi:hypothetical protein
VDIQESEGFLNLQFICVALIRSHDESHYFMYLLTEFFSASAA